jgi:hypothetical protein
MSRLQADSGADGNLYAQLSVAPTVLLDARMKGSAEHASFDEAEQAGGPSQHAPLYWAWYAEAILLLTSKPP